MSREVGSSGAMLATVAATQREATKVRSGVATARDVVSRLTETGRIIGLTGGQFSLIDVLEALVEKCSEPPDVVVATWTAGVRDAEMAARLHRLGRCASFRLVVDRSFPTRQPKYVARVRELFGDEAIRVTNIHAKFLAVGPYLVRTSMNLNKNRRVELVEIDEDAELVQWWRDRFIDPLWGQEAGLTPTHKQVATTFRQQWGAATEDDDRKEVALGRDAFHESMRGVV